MKELKPKAKAIISNRYTNVFQISCINEHVRKSIFLKVRKYLISPTTKQDPSQYPSSERWVVSNLYDDDEVVILINMLLDEL